MEVFKDSQFIGKELKCHKDFIPYLTLMNTKAKDLDLEIYITSSLRDTIVVPEAVVTPAKMSNHLVGFAIDCNLVEKDKWWNNAKLKYPTGNVLKFIEYCGTIKVRWGGFFHTPDNVHFDYPLNLKNPEKYKEILESK